MYRFDLLVLMATTLGGYIGPEILFRHAARSRAATVASLHELIPKSEPKTEALCFLLVYPNNNVARNPKDRGNNIPCILLSSTPRLYS